MNAHEKILDQIINSSTEGDVERLIDLLKDDITIYADGGGKVFVFGKEKIGTETKPLKGKINSAKFVIQITDKVQITLPGSNFKKVLINGLPSMVVRRKAEVKIE